MIAGRGKMPRMATNGNTCRVGSGSGFWGDMIDPAVELIERGELDYIGFDLLAELTVSVLTRAKAKDPSRGHIPDVTPIMRACLAPAVERGVKIVTNGGGANPPAGARAVAEVAGELGLGDVAIGMIEGDDITDRIGAMRADGVKFANLDTGEDDLDRIADRIVGAHVYTGSEGIIEALEQGADVVIGGRLADSALFVGPLMHHFGWRFGETDPNLIGAAITIGHVIECGGISSGGMSSQWRLSKDPWRLGFPLAEVSANGDAIITKVDGSGGVINEWTIKEHLLYEVHDPADYRLPDGVADLTAMSVKEVGPDSVAISGMRGRPQPEMLKVQIGYEDGWIAEGTTILPWPDALEKADWCENMVRNRIKYLGVEPVEQRFDRIGIDALAGSTAPKPDYEPNEVGLRMAFKTNTRAEADACRRAALITATVGPVGTAFGVPHQVRKVIGLWPTLVPRELVENHVRTFKASDAAELAGAPA